MLVLNLFDKIDNDKLTPEAHFLNDLGLDSLDHVEIMLMIEVEIEKMFCLIGDCRSYFKIYHVKLGLF